MSDGEIDWDSDAPEEFTSQQGMQQDEVIRNIQRENKARVVREGKERRKKLAQKLTPKALPKGQETGDKTIIETHEDSHNNKGMLPDDIVKLLAAREKIVFTSDSEDEISEKKPASRKRRPKKTGFSSLHAFFTSLPPSYALPIHVFEPILTKKDNFFGLLNRLEPVILNDMPPAQCVQNSLDFLKKRKMQVSRSSAVLNNSDKALCFLYKSGMLK